MPAPRSGRGTTITASRSCLAATASAATAIVPSRVRLLQLVCTLALARCRWLLTRPAVATAGCSRRLRLDELLTFFDSGCYSGYDDDVSHHTAAAHIRLPPYLDPPLVDGSSLRPCRGTST